MAVHHTATMVYHMARTYGHDKLIIFDGFLSLIQPYFDALKRNNHFPRPELKLQLYGSKVQSPTMTYIVNVCEQKLKSVTW